MNTSFAVRLCSVANGALSGLGLGFKAMVSCVRVSCRSSVSVMSFKDVSEFLCFKRR